MNINEQQHSGSGDNVAGNKVVNNKVDVRTKFIAIAFLIVGLVAITMWWHTTNHVKDYVDGFVMSSGGEQLANSNVSLIIDGVEYIEVTDSKGHFSFKNVDTDDITPPLIFNVSNDKRSTSHVESTYSQNGPKIKIQLPPGEAPFDVTYIDLKEKAVGLFMNEQLENKWINQKTDNIRTLRSETFETLQHISEYYTRKNIINATEYFPILYKDENYKTVVVDNFEGIYYPALMGSENNYETFEGLSLFIRNWDHLKAALTTIKDWKDFDGNTINGPDLWTELHNDYGSIPMENFKMKFDGDLFMNMEKYATKKEWDFILSSYLDSDFDDLNVRRTSDESLFIFYEYLFQGKIPKDFLRFWATGYSGCDEKFAQINVAIPTYEVRVVIIENNTNEALSLDSFYLKENISMDIRSINDDNEKLKETDITARKLFARNKLQKGEKLAIPIKIIFKDSKEPENIKEYIFGPSADLQKVGIKKEQFAVRKLDPSLVMIYQNLAVGSCPYVFTQDVDSDVWQLETHMIYMQNNKEKEGSDTISLNRFNGSVLIREIDPETSYIDHIQLDVVSENGDKNTFNPVNHNKISKIDGQYFIMNQGDEKEIDFNVPKTLIGKNNKYYFISSGYYVPWNKQEL